MQRLVLPDQWKDLITLMNNGAGSRTQGFFPKPVRFLLCQFHYYYLMCLCVCVSVLSCV